MYLVDNDCPSTLIELLAANECFDACDIATLREMNPGDSITMGGGAAAEFVIRAIADDEIERLTAQWWCGQMALTADVGAHFEFRFCDYGDGAQVEAD